MKLAHLEPDIVTYGVLALGCKTGQEARDLLLELQDGGVRYGSHHNLAVTWRKMLTLFPFPQIKYRDSRCDAKECMRFQTIPLRHGALENL